MSDFQNLLEVWTARLSTLQKEADTSLWAHLREIRAGQAETLKRCLEELRESLDVNKPESCPVARVRIEQDRLCDK